MSNRLFIVPTHFTDVPNGDVSFGVRVFDDYDKAYDNTWEQIPEDDMEVLKQTLLIDDEKIRNIIEFHVEHQKGMYIGETWYNYEEYKSTVKEVLVHV